MADIIFIGVDGGASKCVVRVEDEAGKLLGESTTGPASISLSVEQAWHSINTGLAAIFKPLGINPSASHRPLHCAMGLAGTEIQESYLAFKETTHPFKTLELVSDAHTACLGAHAGEDGAIVAVGTGVVGYQIDQGKITKVSGWGFPQDDQGGGAWLGLSAVQLTLQSLDQRITANELTKALYAYFDNDLPKLIKWVNQANSTDFATLAPLVIEQSQRGIPAAIMLVQHAAQSVVNVIQALQQTSHNALRCALLGGLAPYLHDRIEKLLQSKLAPCQFSPEVGAILMARRHLLTQKENT